MLISGGSGLPRLVDANSWRRWRAAHAVDARESALRELACERISAILSNTRTIYSPVEIDVGPLSCPHCSERMDIGSIDTCPIVCPDCGHRSARSLGIHAHVILRPVVEDEPSELHP